MTEIYNPERALFEDWKTYFTERRTQNFIIQAKDGDIEMTGAWMLLNITACMPLIRRGVQIEKKHIFLNKVFTTSSHNPTMTQISRTLEDMGYSREELGHDILDVKTEFHNITYTHIAGYVGTMDIDSIKKTILNPEIESQITPDYGDVDDKNIARMEEIFEEHGKKVLSLLKGDKFPDNVFRGPLLCGALKEKQFLQFATTAGPRTDTDDNIFGRPVIGSYVGGMTGIWDLAIDSRSATKATHYNSTEMPRTQYVNRKLHLLSSAIQHLYLGDCGSKVYMDYEVPKDHVDKFIGMFYRTAGGELRELTEERYDEVVGRVVKFRDPITCRYTNGYCEMCGGTITRSFSRTGNVGFLANVNSGGKAAQQVLSTKHLILTNSAKYEVPEALAAYLIAVNNEIFIKPSIRGALDRLAIGFEPKDVSKTNDLMYVDDDSELTAAYYSDIKYLRLGKIKEDGTITQYGPRVLMGNKQKKYPHLSHEVLSLLRSGKEELSVQDRIHWLRLDKIDITRPIMNATVVNQSIKAFVADFSNLMMKKIERYTSANDAMRDITRMAWERVDPHVVHLSVMVKSCLISSKKDYHIPVVTDPDNVQFSTLGRIIPMRSIGAMFAFERMNLATNKLITYITPKQTGPYDKFMGFEHDIERDMHWPAGTRPDIRM